MALVLLFLLFFFFPPPRHRRPCRLISRNKQICHYFPPMPGYLGVVTHGCAGSSRVLRNGVLFSLIAMPGTLKCIWLRQQNIVELSRQAAITTWQLRLRTVMHVFRRNWPWTYTPEFILVFHSLDVFFHWTRDRWRIDSISLDKWT